MSVEVKAEHVECVAWLKQQIGMQKPAPFRMISFLVLILFYAKNKLYCLSITQYQYISKK